MAVPGSGSREHRWHTGSDPFLCLFSGLWALHVQRNRLQDIKDHIDRNGEHLADASSQSRTPDSHFREKSDSPDQERVQDDVADTSYQEGDHRYFHPSYRLEKFFKEKADGNYRGKQENDGGIFQSHPDYGFILRVHPKECGHNRTEKYHSGNMHKTCRIMVDK